MNKNTSSKEVPLIVTLQIEEQYQQFFNLLRQEHFPAHANFMDAHLTLFHKLPSDKVLVREKLKEFANRDEFILQVNSIRNIGNGVVYTIQSEELQLLHSSMKKVFRKWLIRKDAGRYWPHITIQNKATAYKAKVLHEKLSETFQPFELKATGFNTWLYLKGPWQAVDSFSFQLQ